MKQLIIIVSLVLFSFYPLKDNQKVLPYLAGTYEPVSRIYPDYLPTEYNINANPDFTIQDAGLNNIDRNWYSASADDILKEEYNITYSEELKSFQSPNRANNIRFTYQNNGFTAKTMQTKIPLFDVKDKSICEKDKKYKSIEDWSVTFGIKNYESGITNEKFSSSGNKASIENENIRIDYTNTKEGMRQDFIIKEKPSGDNDLQLIMNVRTNLKMSVSKDKVVFRSGKDGSDKMHYSSLKAWDANGKILNAYFDKQNDRQFAIRIIDKDAQYPVTVDPLSGAPDWTVTCDQQWSRYGDGVSCGDINGDGFDDVAVGAPAYEPGGAVFLYFGSAAGPSSFADRILYGSGIGFGNRINCKGDINDDNYCDLIVGDPFIGSGKVWIYYGSLSGVSDSAKSQLQSVSGGANFGYSVSSADVNGDGFSDVIAGCQTESDNRQIGAYVFLGSASGINELPAWTASVPAGTNYEGFYWSVSGAGDINNDGYEDIIAGTFSGYALIYKGSANRGMYEPADNVLSQPEPWFGQSVSSAGDINSDGFDDVAAGSFSTAYLYYGSQNEFNTNFIILNSGSYNLTSAGDFNNDGFGDFITTDFGNGIYLYFGSSTGISTSPYVFACRATNISNGDINGDGISDIVGASEPSGFGYYGSSVYTPPEITHVSPSQNAISVNKSSDISVTFNQEMKVSTLNNDNIKVYASYSGFLNCAMSYDALQRKVIINPFNDFKTGEDISVTLTSGIESSAGTAIEPFVYQFTAAVTGGTGIFTEASLILPDGTHPTGIAAADINSDGNTDLIIGKDNSIRIYKNNGAAQFSVLSLINENGFFRTGDIDNDGDIDILISSNVNLKTYLNDGTGLFALSNTTAGSAGVMADLDGDGDLDIAFGSVSIEKNINGIFYPDSSLGITPCYGLSAFISPLSVTDFNNDGRLDISVYEYGLYCDILEFCTGCGSLHVFKNSPQNNFTEHVIHSVNLFDGYAIFEKNLLLSFNKDNDSDVDFITPQFNLSNLGNETFAADDSPNGFMRYALKGDFDGDGDIDIFASSGNPPYVYKNDGQGNFSEIVSNNFMIFPPPDPVTADFDNNGSLDIAAVKYNSNGVSVLLNDYNCAHPQFSISGSPMILVGSTDNVFISSAVNGNWSLTNYGSTQASIPVNSTGDTVLVSAGNNPGQFTLYHTAFYECGGDTLLSAIIYVDNALPVKLAEFTSVINGRNVTLNWTTAEELNNSGFDIERSSTENQWMNAGFVSGHGNISELTKYSFTDKNLTTGKYKYRLRQIDFNGNFEYFELAEEVSIGIPDKFELSQNYPNPFNPVTNLEFGIPKPGFVSLKIYDVLGREMVTLVNETKEPGYYKIKFNAADLASGVYFYRMEAGDFVEVKKFVVMK